MSRSEPNEIKSPAQRFYKWSGTTGNPVYFDKERKENVEVKLPFAFMVLDQLATIGGFSDTDNSGYWSNEVRNTTTEEFIVRTKAGIVDQGLYQELTCRAKGAKYAKSVYIAYYDENNDLTIGNFKMVGACLSAWIEFSKGRDVLQDAVVLSGATEAKKGATKYFVPVFEQKKVSREAFEAANELDKKLQAYLKEYFKLKQQANGTEEDYRDERDQIISEPLNAFAGAADHYTPSDESEIEIPF